MSTDFEFDYGMALKRQNFMAKDVAGLREKIASLGKVPKKLSDRKLLCFLNACSGVDEAANVIATYYEIRLACPSIFSNRDPLSPEVQQCFASQWNFHLPSTPSNHSVIYHCLSSPKASDYVFHEACKTFFMTLDSLLYSRGPSDGLIIIFDMRNVGMRHLLRPKIETLKYFFRYLQDALPAKLEAMHIVNCVSFFDMVLTLVKPFMKSEIIQKIHLHHGTNYDELHKNVAPRSCLPSDFGGDLASAEELHKDHIKEFMRLRDYFIQEEKETSLSA